MRERARVRARWIAALLGACLLAVCFMPVRALAAEPDSLDEVYVSASGDDKNGDGSKDNPLATIQGAIDAVNDGGTIYLQNDVTLGRYVFIDGKAVTIDGQGHMVFRKDGFIAQNDARGGYNPAMIEVQNGAELTLRNITLDDLGKHVGSVFQEQPTSGDNKNNESKVQAAIIEASGDGHGSIILDSGAVLKNFGGMSAVRIGGQLGSGSSLTMKAGSMICDDAGTVHGDPTTASNDSSTADGVGPAGAVWNQGGTFTMEEGSSIQNLTGRAIFDEDGAKTYVNGNISNITSNESERNYSWEQNGGFGGVVYFGIASTTELTLGPKATISNIQSHDGNGKDVICMLVSAKMTTEAGSKISDSTVSLADSNGGRIYINGAVENIESNNVIIRGRGDSNTFVVGETGKLTNCSTTDTGGLYYLNGGKPTIEIAGTIDGFNKPVLYISNNGTRQDGTITLTKTGTITNITGDAIKASDPSLVTIQGAITNCSGYAVDYNPKSAGSLLKIEASARISDNRSGNAQIKIEGSLSATDVSEHAEIALGSIQGNTTIDLNPFDVTLDEDRADIQLGNAGDAASAAIKDAVGSEHPDWTLVGSKAIWMQPSESSVHFMASRSYSVKNTGLFAVYIPLDEDGKPQNGAQVACKEVGNGDAIDVTLDGLTPGQSYALMFVNNTEYTLSPDNVTIYTGGGQGDETYDDGGFPALTMYHSVDEIKSMTIDGVEISEEDGTTFESALTDLIEVSYLDGKGNPVDSDETPGEYTVSLAWKGNEAPKVRINGNEVNPDLGDGELIVRHTADIEGATTGETTHELLDVEPTEPVTHTEAIATKGYGFLSPKFYTNDDEDREVDAAGVQLLDDALLTKLGDGRQELMEQKAADYLGEPGEGQAYRYDFHYLDLVDAYNGNAWVSASYGTTVYLPYPEGVSKENAESLGLTVIHYPGLHREYGIAGQAEVEEALDACQLETKEVEYTNAGIRFDVPREGFSPFAVVWKAQAHTITASAGTGGTISPSGEVKVGEGGSQAFAITANPGYEIADVLVDGKSVGAVSTYTFDKVAADHTIAATFRSTGGGTVTPTRYTITATAGQGGSISPSGTVTVSAGADRTFTITPDEGNKVADVVIDGTSVGALGSYTFEDVRANHTISVTFARGNAPADPSDTGVDQWFDVANHDAFMRGYDDGTGTFGPNDNMSRAHAAQMFYNMLKDKSRGDIEVTFPDVDPDAWYAEAVGVLASRGIIRGDDLTGTFRPSDPVSRAEFTAMAMRFSKGDYTGENIFTDVHEGDWFYGVVVGSVKYGWINGYQDGSGRFGPADTLTRADAATIANRMLGRVPDGVWISAHLGDLRLFPDVDRGHYAFFDVVEATNSHDYEKSGGFETWTGLK